jgi:hypothetical protein
MAVHAPTGHNAAQTAFVDAEGIAIAHRRLGRRAAAVPLGTLQHRRGDLDNWDSVLTDALPAEKGSARHPTRRTASASSTRMRWLPRATSS